MRLTHVYLVMIYHSIKRIMIIHLKPLKPQVLHVTHECVTTKRDSNIALVHLPSSSRMVVVHAPPPEGVGMVIWSPVLSLSVMPSVEVRTCISMMRGVA